MQKTSIIVFLALILILVSVNAATNTVRLSLKEGESQDFNGKRISLVNLDYDKERVIVCVNGEKTILKSRTKTINGATLDLRKVTMNHAEIRIWVNCPDCECDDSCEENYKCFDQCFTDKDCDDGNDLTEDICSGTPKKCYNKKVKECTSDSHCDDGYECTIDKCSEILGKCVHTYIENCKPKSISHQIKEQKNLNSVTGSAIISKETNELNKNLHPIIVTFVIGIMVVALAVKVFKKKQF